jgi:DNA-binding MarR family transcriptional regulator
MTQVSTSRGRADGGIDKLAKTPVKRPLWLTPLRALIHFYVWLAGGRFGFARKDIARTLHAFVDPQAWERNLEPARKAAFFRLQRRKELSPRELADLLELEPNRLPQAIDVLIQAGLVERRGQGLRLTPEAARRLDDFAAAGDPILRAALAGQDESSVATLRQALGRLNSILKTELNAGV